MRFVAVLALLVLAGCAGTPVGLPADADGQRLAPVQWAAEASGCLTSATFFLVEPSRASPYLPPGFHAADLSEFLYDTPVTAGKVAAFIAASTCDHFNLTAGAEQRTGALEVLYVGFYVQAPHFASAYANQRADHNFYAVTSMTPLDNGTAATRAPSDVAALYGWNQTEAHITLDVENMTAAAPSSHALLRRLARNNTVPDHADVLVSQGAVTVGGEAIFSFRNEAFFPQPFESRPRLRFWQTGPEGLGFMQFDLPSKTVMAGPLDDCAMPNASILRDIAGDQVGSADGRPCGATESFGLVFDRHALSGSLHHMQGVHPV